MHILNTGQRHAASRADSGTKQRESDQDAYRRFAALLSEPTPPCGVAMPAQSAPPRSVPRASVQKNPHAVGSAGRHGTCQAAAAHGVAIRTRSGRATLEVLHFRLINGPLADLEIEARTHGEALSLRVTVRDLQHFERIVGDRKQLASALAQQFDRPVSLELLHADSTAE